MKKILVLLLILFSIRGFSQQLDGAPRPRPVNCNTENSCPRNTIFHQTNFRFDKLGYNFNSLNWDHILICRERFLLSFNLGINYYTFAKMRAAGIPLGLNLMIGGGALMAEIGTGLNYQYIYKNYDEVSGKFNDNLSYLSAVGHLGLRYQQKSSIFFRVGYTPMYSLINNDKISITNKKNIPIIHDRKFYSMFGLGIGYCF